MNTIKEKRSDHIYGLIQEAFAPTFLNVTDESHLHAGHAGARPEGESHFRMTLVTERFAGLSRIARHRAVYDVLAKEMAGRIHALALHTFTPEEYAHRQPPGADGH